MIKFDLINPSANNAVPPINMYFKQDAWQGKPGLVGTPGLDLFAETATGEVRGSVVFGDYLYVVVDKSVWKIDTTGASTKLPNTLSTTTGKVDMARDPNNIMLTDGSAGYVITSDVLTEISDEHFTTPVSSTYQDGYHIYAQSGVSTYWISSINDPTTWAAGDYDSADYKWDTNQAVISAKRKLIIFGSESAEIHYNSGDAGFPFSLDFVIDYGTTAGGSVAYGNYVYFLAQDRTIRRLDGQTPVKVSNPSLDKALNGYTTISDARGSVIRFEGDEWYVITFPTENVTHAFSSATQTWFQWSSGLNGGRHRISTYSFFNNQHIIGDYENGNLYKLNKETYTDNNATIKSVIQAPVLNQSKQWIFNSAFELFIKTGVGLQTNHSTLGVGVDPIIILDWSDDMGRTWKNEHWLKIGKIGKGDTRVRHTRLGRFKERIYRCTITDPVERVIIDANLE